MTINKLPGPQDISTPRKLHYWLQTQHPGHQILYVDRSDCPGFPLLTYLSSIQVVASDDLTHIAAKDGLRDLIWEDAYSGDDLEGDTYEIYENKILMGSSSTNGQVKEVLINGFVDFKMDNTSIRAYQFDWIKAFQGQQATFLVWQAETDHIGRKLIEDTFRWERTLRQEAWMFDEGWKKSKQLYTSIQKARKEDIVLPDDILESLCRDADSFFSSKEVYRGLGVAWKRGILLVGPPGNGKTETVKAILRQQSDKPMLYVKSFQTGRMGTPEKGIRAIFEKARSCSPCILVMEDLDSLVTPETRSFLLNEIDGLEANDGILIIATSNHPDKLDNAFTKRPSRFDTKYNLTNPSPFQRTRFINKWLDEKLAAVFPLDEKESSERKELVERLVDGSHDWSYAFLKEIFISFALIMASSPSSTTENSPAELLLNILGQLQSHISDMAKDEEKQGKEEEKSSQEDRKE